MPGGWGSVKYHKKKTPGSLAEGFVIAELEDGHKQDFDVKQHVQFSI